MNAPSTTKAAVISLLRSGFVTLDEGADLASASRQLVQEWALREGIDVATIRAIYLLKIWRSQLQQERDKRLSEQNRTEEGASPPQME